MANPIGSDSLGDSVGHTAARIDDLRAMSGFGEKDQKGPQASPDMLTAGVHSSKPERSQTTELYGHEAMGLPGSQAPGVATIDEDDMKGHASGSSFQPALAGYQPYPGDADGDEPAPQDAVGYGPLGTVRSGAKGKAAMIPAVAFEFPRPDQDDTEPPPPGSTNPTTEQEGTNVMPVTTGETTANGSDSNFAKSGTTSGPSAYVQPLGETAGTPRGRESRPPTIPHEGEEAGNRGRTLSRGSIGAEISTKKKECRPRYHNTNKLCKLSRWRGARGGG